MMQNHLKVGGGGTCSIAKEEIGNIIADVIMIIIFLMARSFL